MKLVPGVQNVGELLSQSRVLRSESLLGVKLDLVVN